MVSRMDDDYDNQFGYCNVNLLLLVAILVSIWALGDDSGGIDEWLSGMGEEREKRKRDQTRF